MKSKKESKKKRRHDLVFNIYHVGQGDSTLIEFPNGKKYGLIDSFKPPWRKPPFVKVLQEKAKDHGRCEMAFVCISHPHRDHVLGVSDILKIKDLNIDEFWHPLPDIEEFLAMKPCADASEKNYAWAKAAEVYYNSQIKEFVSFSRKIRKKTELKNTRPLRAIGDIPQIEGVQIYCLNPCQGTLGKYKEEIKKNKGYFDTFNRNLLDTISATFLFVYGENSFLYSSDIQGEEWGHLVANVIKLKDINPYFPVSLVKASHHGGPRSFYDSLWQDILGEKKNYVFVSGGNATHPNDKFIDSVLKSNNHLFCTGKSQTCGRGKKIRKPKKHKSFHVTRWMERYGKQLVDHLEPCYGDIRIVLPKKGPPRIEPQHLDQLCADSVGKF